MFAAYRPSTQRSYASAQALYEDFYEESELAGDPWPASDAAILAFVSDCNKRKLQQDTISQYVAAIRSKNTLLGPVGPDQVALALRGVGNQRVAEAPPKPSKPAWEAAWVVRAAELLSASLRSRTQVPKLPDLQAYAVTIVGFLFALRSQSVASVNSDHLKFEGDAFHLVVEVYKDKGVPKPKSVMLSAPATQQPFRALFDFLDYMHRLVPERKENFLVSEFIAKSDEPSRAVDRAMDHVLSLLKIDHPMRTQQKSHALRRGAAIAMLAVGVDVDKRRLWGGWKSHESMKPYVAGYEFAKPTAEQRSCFSWMLGAE